jgi:hypothetical protein
MSIEYTMEPNLSARESARAHYRSDCKLVLTHRTAREKKNRQIAASDCEQQRDSPEQQIHRSLQITGVGVRQSAHTDLELLGKILGVCLSNSRYRGRNSAAAASKLTLGLNLISGPYCFV